MFGHRPIGDRTYGEWRRPAMKSPQLTHDDTPAAADEQDQAPAAESTSLEDASKGDVRR